VTRAELVAKYERLATDTPVPWLADVYKAVAGDLRTLQRDTGQPRLSYNTTEAARACGVTAKTITHWCEAGKHFPNARKTSPGKGGRWIVPASDIEAFMKRRVA
jgi:predicted DNA-binding transcriptional regulator AlpA